MDIAIYDLDQTITRRPTFTRFLLFYAWSVQSYRLLALPLWVVAMAGHATGLYDRKTLKQFGIALFIGRRIPPDLLYATAKKFADKVVPADVQPGVLRSIEDDRQSGRKLVLATAAPHFYADVIADRLGFGGVMATRHQMNADGSISNRIDGENCFGEEKLARVKHWLQAEGLNREDVNLRFYSDHAIDAPMFDWVDEPILVATKPGSRLRALAKANFWQIVDFS